ncbi:MAG TPA: cytochrome c [Bryobacteraceae bacterium]|nr:cytochrome c [Bryobacteraceae bacterium]
MHRFFSRAGLLCASAVMTVAGLSSPAAAQEAGNAAAGKQIFLKYTCYGCHGFSGQNGPGARLVPMRMTQSGFISYVRNPRTRQMPSYSTKVLSDAQLGDVYAYIKTLPASRAAKDIPELNQFKEQ